MLALGPPTVPICHGRLQAPLLAEASEQFIKELACRARC
jgi:hypothetical protein